MSVPQIAVLAISISTSLGPTLGSGMSASQMPGAACCLTSAFIGGSFGKRCSSADDAELAADAGESRERLLKLRAGEGGRHLCADACLPLGHHRKGEADDVDPALKQCIGHAAGERRIAQHHRDNRVLAGLEIEAGTRE